MSSIQIERAERLKRLPPYLFAQIDKMIQYANYDIGNKTVPTLSIREEREHMLKTLFVRPVFNI